MSTAHVFGDDVTAAQIFAPDRVPTGDGRLAPHCLAALDQSFAERVTPGDFVVAGREFGCGVYRANAAPTLRETGVGAVLAESFGRLFLRDAIGVGLPVVEVPDVTAHVADGDVLTVDPAAGELRNETTGSTSPLGSYPAFVTWSLLSTRQNRVRPDRRTDHHPSPSVADRCGRNRPATGRGVELSESD